MILPTAAIPMPTPAPTDADSVAASLDLIEARVALTREFFSLRPVERKFITRDELLVEVRDGLREEQDDIYGVQSST